MTNAAIIPIPIYLSFKKNVFSARPIGSHYTDQKPSDPPLFSLPNAEITGVYHHALFQVLCQHSPRAGPAWLMVLWIEFQPLSSA